jgi:oligoendopeptidase F
MLLDYAKLREIGNAIIYGSPTPDASQQCEALQSEIQQIRSDCKERVAKGFDQLRAAKESHTADLQQLMIEKDQNEKLKESNTRLLERVKELEKVLRQARGLTNYIPIELEHNVTSIEQAIESALNPKE